MKRMRAILLATLLVIATAAALIHRSYDRELSRARDAIRSGGRIVQTGAGPIEYAETGAGRPLLSIHGAGGGYDQGLANVADFIGGGFRVIAPSRYGYLGTPIPADASSTAQADTHAALLAELKIDKTIVVSISAGARSAVDLALRHPRKVTALVLIVPGTYAPTSPVAIEASRGSALAFWLVNAGADFAWWAMEKIAPSALIRFIGVPPQLFATASQAEKDRVMRVVRNIEPLSHRFAGINIDSNPDNAPPAYGNIVAPTLVISARDDLFNTLPAAEFAAQSIPNANLVVFKTGGHLLLGRQREVRKVFNNFIATLTNSDAPRR